jgi:hypothetical protein
MMRSTGSMRSLPTDRTARTSAICGGPERDGVSPMCPQAMWRVRPEHRDGTLAWSEVVSPTGFEPALPP